MKLKVSKSQVCLISAKANISVLSMNSMKNLAHRVDSQSFEHASSTLDQKQKKVDWYVWE